MVSEMPTIRHTWTGGAPASACLSANAIWKAVWCDRFTMADIPAGTTLYRYFGLDLERPHIPNVEAWYQRLTARPAYREHVMVPFADLRGRPEY